MLLQLEDPYSLSWARSAINNRWCKELKAALRAGTVSPYATDEPSPDYRPLIEKKLAKLQHPGRLQLVYMLAARLYDYERIHG